MNSNLKRTDSQSINDANTVNDNNHKINTVNQDNDEMNMEETSKLNEQEISNGSEDYNENMNDENFENEDMDNFENENDDNDDIYYDDDQGNSDSSQILDINDSDSDEFIYEEDAENSSKISKIIYTYNAFMYYNPAQYIKGIIFLKLPRDFLPLSDQVVYDFVKNETLLNISIGLQNYSWTQRPKFYNIEHPLFKKNYIGTTLVEDAFKNFFSPNYKPKQGYRSIPYLLTPSGQPNQEKLNQLCQSGFDRIKASNALVLCSNDLNKAINFLKTGELQNQKTRPDFEYETCPLIYLVLEIADCFLDIHDHCCICRKKLTPGLKPCICDSNFCIFQFSQIGVGASILNEISRDVFAADLLFSIFSAAIFSNYFNPAPPLSDLNKLKTIAHNLPSMLLLSRCENEQMLKKTIGDEDSYEVLRWVLFSNRSHLITLKDNFKLNQFDTDFQFLSLISTPEAERTFKALKNKYGSTYLFHGSPAYNWHSIFRNGLKNASGTEMQRNGAALGPGIYFAKQSQTSFFYAPSAQNLYSKSLFGENIKILALCEVANVPELKNHGWAFTLTREEACIVRFLFVNGNYDIDILKEPPKNIPKLNDILNAKAEEIVP